jgi:hypothetical protein
VCAREGDRRLLGKHLEDPTVAGLEGPHFPSVQIETSVDGSVDEEGDGHHAAQVRSRIEGGIIVVESCDGEIDARSNPSAKPPDAIFATLIGRGHQHESVTLQHSDAGPVCIAQTSGQGDDAVEHLAQVAGVGADELEDRAGRGLQLE